MLKYPFPLSWKSAQIQNCNLFTKTIFIMFLNSFIICIIAPTLDVNIVGISLMDTSVLAVGEWPRCTEDHQPQHCICQSWSWVLVRPAVPSYIFALSPTHICLLIYIIPTLMKMTMQCFVKLCTALTCWHSTLGSRTCLMMQVSSGWGSFTLMGFTTGTRAGSWWHSRLGSR